MICTPPVLTRVTVSTKVAFSWPIAVSYRSLSIIELVDRWPNSTAHLCYQKQNTYSSERELSVQSESKWIFHLFLESKQFGVIFEILIFIYYYFKN